MEKGNVNKDLVSGILDSKDPSAGVGGGKVVGGVANFDWSVILVSPVFWRNQTAAAKLIQEYRIK